MEKFNLLDFIARLGEACLKSRPVSDQASSAAESTEKECCVTDKNARTPSSFSKKPTALTGYSPQNGQTAKSGGKADGLSPYGEKDMTDSEKALVQMIRNHDKLSKAIDEKLSSTEEK